MFNIFNLLNRVFILLKKDWNQKKLFMGIEHQINTKQTVQQSEHQKRDLLLLRVDFFNWGVMSLYESSSPIISSSGWFSSGLTDKTCWPSISLMTFMSSVFAMTFGRPNDIWGNPSLLSGTWSSCWLLFRPHYRSLWLFLFSFFLNCLELLVRSKQVYLPPFTLLQYGLWTLFQKVNCFALAFCTGK